MNYNFIKNESSLPTASNFKDKNYSSRDSHDKFMHPVRLNYGLQPYNY